MVFITSTQVTLSWRNDMVTTVTTLPQNHVEVKKVTIFDVVSLLDETLPPYVGKLNVWIAGRLAKYGVTHENLIFLMEQEQEATTEQRMYWENIIRPLGIASTGSENWKDTMAKLRLYNLGELIIDKKTLQYKQVPYPVTLSTALTREELFKRLPKEIPFTETIWLTGGIVKNDETYNDIDLVVFEPIEDKTRYAKIRLFIEKVIGWKTDIGTREMPEREPIFFKLYENGILNGNY